MIKESKDLFYQDIKQLLIDARKDVYRKINSFMVETYWEIGRRIVEQEQQGKGRAGYGEYLITNLSKYLGDTFGKGFSVANLKNFRQFYLIFRENQKLYTLCRELSWSHIRLIMRIDDERLKQADRWDYFNEWLERIRDIRASEKRFYQKIRDIYDTAIDYDKDSKQA